MANVPVQLKRIGTQAAAAASAAVLLDGQAIYVKDSKRLYLGNGTSTLAQLVAAGAYLLPHPEFIAYLGAELTTLSELLTVASQDYADTQAQAAYDDSRAYADSLVASTFRPAGSWDADTGTWPITGTGAGGIVRAGDVFKVTRAGSINSQTYDVGDTFYAIIDSPGQDEENWSRFESNDNQATESYRGTALIATESEVVNGVDVPSIVTPKHWWSAFASAFTAVGHAIRQLATPGGESWLRVNTNGTVSARTAAETRSDLGAQTQSAVLDTLAGATANGQSLVTAANYAAMRSLLGLWTTVARSTDSTPKTNDTTLTADDVLKVPMLANTRYAIRGKVFFSTGAAGDFKFRHSGPASPTRITLQRQTQAAGSTSAANLGIDTAYSSADIVSDGGTGRGFVRFDGIIENGANAGDFEFHWAQNVNNGTGTFTVAGSYIEWRIIQ